MDDNREPGVLKLIETLEDYCYSEILMCGHQNAGHIGVTITEKDGTSSDIKVLTGKQPAVVGIDTLSFGGYEGSFNETVKIVKNLNKQGVIITLSSHMPNFSLGGPEDFFDYSSNDTNGNVAARIMPGGDLNAKYRKFLDRIADFCNECVDIEGGHIPMIFRPFHEDNGDWFWWGREYVSDEDFIALFRYTVGYLRFNKDVKNLAFAYSPNGPIKSEAEYMARYPGDDCVDIMGLDLYHDRPSINQAFYKQLGTSLNIIFECAIEHGKVHALTEVGMRVLDASADGLYYEGIAPSGNNPSNWFTGLLNTLMQSEGGLRCAYLLFWANFSDTQFWVPYKGHEMADEFLKFANDPHIKMAPVI